MSVRTALAKICAATCGGAIIGGGAVHMTEVKPQPHYSYTKNAKPAKRVAVRKPRRLVTRVRKVVTTRTPAPAPTVV